MSGPTNSVFDEAPAAWALWQFVTTRVPQDEIPEFSNLMAGYRDEVQAGSITEPAVRKLAVPQVMELHRLTGRIIDEAQRERWTAAGRCGTCGFDGERSGCQDCGGGQQ